MLKRFTVENYKNFMNPISIDFSLFHDYKFNTECIKNNLLSKAIIYGNNGSGKSNFGYALFDIVMTLTDKNLSPNQLDELSFLNADCTKKTASFKYEFKFGKDDITFEYEKDKPTHLTKESLIINNELVYDYNFNSRMFQKNNMKLIDAETLNFEYYESNLSILRYIANNTIQKKDSFIKKIMDFTSHMLWFRSLQDNSYIGYTTGVENISNWLIDQNLTSEFQKFVKDMAKLELNISPAFVNGGPQPTKILIEQHLRNPLIFEQTASSGTHALEILFYWSKKFEDVSLLFIDEFDAFYHFDLAKNIVKYVIGFDNLQAIFTTHNSYLATNDVMRADCYFLLESGKLSSFAERTKREIREGHNLEKMLRNGEFNEY